MRLALAQAALAPPTGDVPVGCVVLGPDGSVIGRGHNEREAVGDPTAHAEVQAIRAAAASMAAAGIAAPAGAATAAAATAGTGAGVPVGTTAGVLAAPGRGVLPGAGVPRSGGVHPADGGCRVGGALSGSPRSAEGGAWRLTGCTLVVTLEPCTMCAGAIVLSRVDRVVFGAHDAKAGAVGSLWDVVRDRRLNHRPEVVAGVLEQECGAVLTSFFDGHRDRVPPPTDF
ncbi:hypothetical protein AQ490_06125 [Wenjunlia vitaminophila]|uniref:tRNA-specific adenosine deaminase n=2 Tax=Wenjunlia vitaminophila TaxID=76728 RepID=A0A0T6LND4_WENVI|nr:hypothetical protein AQ490_06125 [Wenjunlia vitaminophila]